MRLAHSRAEKNDKASTKLGNVIVARVQQYHDNYCKSGQRKWLIQLFEN